jgi:hypothetical protein
MKSKRTMKVSVMAVGLWIAACSTAPGPNVVVADAGAADATPPPRPRDSGLSGASDAGTAALSSVGDGCTDGAQCTEGTNPRCGNKAFAEPLFPTPASCIDDCTYDRMTTEVQRCANDQGVCLSASRVSNVGVCVGLCTFDEAGLTKKCTGAVVCNPSGYDKDANGKNTGVGFCLGGCKQDADCGGTNKCDKISSLCYRAAKVYTKALGDTCDGAKVSPECNCLAADGKLSMGTCGQSCTTGSANACATGFVCNAVPAKDAMGAPLFPAEPTGLNGNCLKECATSTECNPGFTCKDMPGGKKACSL